MQAEQVFRRVDLLDMEDDTPGAAKPVRSEVDGLAYLGGTLRLNPFHAGIGPIRIAGRLYQLLPDHLNRGASVVGATIAGSALLLVSLSLFPFLLMLIGWIGLHARRTRDLLRILPVALLVLLCLLLVYPRDAQRDYITEQ